MKSAVTTILATFLAIMSFAQGSTKEQRRDSLSKAHSFKDVEIGSSYIYNIDGLFISQKEFESLNLKSEEIKKREIFSKQEAVHLYGEKAKDGAIVISTKKIIVVNKIQIKKDDKSGSIDIGPKKIETIRSINAEVLSKEFGIKHKYGAIVVQTSE